MTEILAIVGTVLSIGFFLLKYFLGKSAEKRKAQEAANELAEATEKKTFEHVNQAQQDAVDSEKQASAAEGWKP